MMGIYRELRAAAKAWRGLLISRAKRAADDPFPGRVDRILALAPRPARAESRAF